MGSMGATLSMEADVLPVLGAFHASQGWGKITIAFERGVPKTITVDETLKEPEQRRNWVRRFTRSRPAN